MKLACYIGVMLLVLGGWAVDHYVMRTELTCKKDSPDVSRKIARGEMGIRDGITQSDLAVYGRVREKLNERTDREARLFSGEEFPVYPIEHK